MEKSLDDYDKSLEALDKEKEKLETLMRRMGQEWAER
jgi:prefoldin subunit 5